MSPAVRAGAVRARVRLLRFVAVLVLLGVSASCAYYNTFYLARKYYMKATDGQPYEVDRDGTTQRSNYNKSMDYAKKLLGVYPKSKYVDDAWLLWARSLVGTDDPLKAVTMLQEFETRFPKSELRPDAEFFLGLAYHAARKHEQSVASFDEFLAQAPKHPLVPYAYYERSKSLISLERYRDAAESAGEILKRFPKHPIFDRALRQRAEARYQQHDWEGARADFRDIGSRALTDEERLTFLLREVDCLESSRAYDDARAVLRDARSHVLPPPPIPTIPPAGSGALPPGGGLPNSQQNIQQVSVTRTPAEEQYGRLTLRMGGVELLAGRVDPAVELYRSVIQDYPRSALSAEAQFRIGFAYETGADDFERARVEYARVREQMGASQFAPQAQARLDNLDRIDRYRTAAGADSLARKAEARFLIAEHYLFNLERPERALEEYQAIYDSSANQSVRARALNARAWVLSRKLDRKASADSLFWIVVREYPATEAQLAARDYLEADGEAVPEKLIVAPKEFAKPLLDPAQELPHPPPNTPKLGTGPGMVDVGAIEYGPGTTPPGARLGAPAPGMNPGMPAAWPNGSSLDSLRLAFALRDSLLRSARADTSSAGRARLDSLRRSILRADSLGRGALMAKIAHETPRAESVVVAPGQGRPPDLSARDSLGTAPGARTAPAARAPLPAAPRVDVPQAHAGRAPAESLAKAAHADSTRRPAPRIPRALTATDSARALASPARAPAPADSALAAPPDSTRVARLAREARESIRRVDARRDSLWRLILKRRAARRDSLGLARPHGASADSAGHTVRVDSTHKSALSPKRVFTASDSLHTARLDSTHARAPQLAAAARDSVRRVASRRDSLRRDWLRRSAARRDSLARGSGQADSLARKPHAKPASPSPSAPRTDSTRGGRP